MKHHHRGVLLKVAVCVLAVYIGGTLVSQSIQISEGRERLARLKTQLAEQQDQNAQTKRVLAEDDEQFMESVARKDLGYAKPSERIYVDASGN